MPWQTIEITDATSSARLVPVSTPSTPSSNERRATLASTGVVQWIPGAVMGVFILVLAGLSLALGVRPTRRRRGGDNR